MVLLPSIEHPIDIKPSSSRVVVKVGDRVVAETTNALTLNEAAYYPVNYIPREDVKMELPERTATSTYRPYKGDAGTTAYPKVQERD